MATNKGSEPMPLPNCDLPGIMVSEILLRLPVKSLLRFRAVCKPWCDFLTNPNFALTYLHHQLGRRPSAHSLLVDDDGDGKRSVAALCPPASNPNSNEDEVLFSMSKHYLQFPFDLGDNYANDYYIDGTCNGLVCLSINHTVTLDSSRKIVIWNPATRKYRFPDVPEADPKYSFFSASTFFANAPTYIGFGFDPETHDYKLLRVWIIPRFQDQPDSFWVWVYSFNNGSWKLIDTDFKYELRGQTPAVVNNNMHWIEKGKMIIVVFHFVYSS